MGKQKRQRRKPHKENPTGLESVKDFEKDEDILNVDLETALQNVYTEVQSCNLEKKLSGLQTLASMSCNSSMAIRIAKEGIAKIIGPLLIDHDTIVQAATASTLRQIADNGGKDAYASLCQDDIMTPLSTLLKQYYSVWQPKGDCKAKETRDEKETFVQGVTLLWTLCENNENIIKYANEENFASFLIKFLDIDVYGIEIAIIATQCLVSLSEDNETAAKEIKQSESILLNLLDLKIDKNMTNFEMLSLKTSISGLLININSCRNYDQTHILCKVLSVLSEVLSIDHRKLLSSLTSILPHEHNASSNNKKMKVQENRKILGAQQQALEILTNLCFDEMESSIDSDIDDSETMDIEAECPDDISVNDKLKITTFPVELIEIMSNCSLIDKIWDKTAAVDKDSQDILDQTPEGKAVLKQIHTLRCRAYLCLNNLLSNLEIEILGGINNMYRKWLEIGTVVFKDINPNDIELLEAATAAMRATLERLTEMPVNIFETLALDDIQPMLNGERQCLNANVRVNLIRMLGNLALILINNNNSANQELVKHISIFLLDACLTETQAWVIAESLDAVMDMYSEDETDRLAADIHLVSKLQALVSHFKSKVQQQKKHLMDNISVVSTVNTNLRRFIKYKEQRIKNLK